jgi:hypothetical protein
MWEKSSPDLVNLFAELAPKDPRVEQKKMFGWPSCFVNGNLFAGLHKESIAAGKTRGEEEVKWRWAPTPTQS